MEVNNNKEFIFKKCQAYKEDFPEIQKDLNIFLNFNGILKYPIESPIDQKIDNQSMLFIDDVFFRNYLQDMPVDYILGKTNFYGIEFNVNYDVLIPRPDTELIIENVLRLTKQKNKINILDIGVGSGCIIVSILKERKNFRGTGIDLSKKCLIISKKNAISHKVSSRLKLYKSDVDKFNLGKYDLIVSNPPYIKKLKLKYLERDVVKFEPKLALDGGLDGLLEIRKVIKKSSDLIKKNGKFILEIGYDQKYKVINLLKKEGFYINSIQKDLAQNDRCIVSTKL